ncbi:MAG: hypothetical protein JOZ69_03170, partial [Myxococcales bacterium]|nr:hypothetical protein [Myxococcales bacterium]
MRGTPPRSPRAPSAERTRERRAACSAWALCVLSVLAGACNDPSKSGGAKAPSSARSEVLEHEACDVTGDRVAPLDTNADGKPDLYRVFDRPAA